jgi:hypothetical protein
MEENLLTVCNHCHDAIHNRYILIEAENDGEPLNANGKLKFKFLAGWRPGWQPRKIV